MRIVEGKKFYKKEIDAVVQIDGDGWDKYNGQNYQWYSLYYNPECGLVVLKANNNGDCYGDYKDRYFASPKSFFSWAQQCERTIGELMGNIDESNEAAMKFVNEVYPNGR